MAELTVGFAGLSHLGIVSAVAAAERGFSVVGFDEDAKLVAALTDGRLPIVEPDLDDLLQRNRARVTFSTKVADLARCDVLYIARDVPTDDAGVSDISAISALIAEVAPAARPDATIVVLCQVPPGFTRALATKDTRFYYQVETLIFGRAVERALLPERLIVGKDDAALTLPASYRAFLAAFQCPIFEMRFESAELAKISINMCLVASIGVANTMAAICEEVGADWSEIVPALRLDARIGPYSYLAPGLGLAGGNLERDLSTVRQLAEAHDCDHSIVDAWTANSELRKDWVYRTLDRLILADKPAARIAVLGLAYKENTHSVKNAASLKLMGRLTGYNVAVYDPVVDATKVVPTAEKALSAMAAVEGADAVAIVTPWPEFRSLDPVRLAGAMRGRVLVDPYALIGRDRAVSAGFTYAALGAATAHA